jgi:hypothetical protein
MKALGVDHPSTSHYINYLAHLLNTTRDHWLALHLYQRVIIGCSNILVLEHPTTMALEGYQCVTGCESKPYKKRLFLLPSSTI